MAKTVASATSSYLSAAEYLKRVDWRTIGDLASDDGTRIDEAALPTNAKLLAALDDASGDLEAAALIGGKYTKDDLAALAATASVGRAKMFRILTDLTTAYMIERRPDLKKDLPAGVERAMAFLKELAQGTQIFGFQEVMDAGHLDHEVTTPQEVLERNGLVVQAERWFGIRADRTPGRTG